MPGALVSESTISQKILTLAAEGLTALPRLSRRLLTRLNSNARRIAQAHQTLSDLLARGEAVPAEAEWLLDNYYVIDDVVRQIRKHLPKSYYRELPIIPTGPHSGLPRIYPLAATIIGSGEGTLRESDIRATLHDYQQSTALRIGELWAVPIMLRLAVLEMLRGLVDQMLETVTARRDAQEVILASRSGTLRSLKKSPSDAYIVAAWEVIREDGAVAEHVDEWASLHLADPHAACHREFCRQAANQVSIGNAVTTLRLLGVIDWTEFFEATSLVEGVLQKDPGGVYGMQDFATRDRCRQAVELLARRCHRPEVDVAQATITAASKEGSHGHVSYYLLGPGRVRFRRELGEIRPVLRRCGDWLRGRPGIVYFGLLISLTLAVMVPLILHLATTMAWLLLPGTLLIGLIASDAGVNLANFIIRKYTTPRVLPRMDFREGIPTDAATFVVVPTLINQPDQASGLTERLERHYLSNPNTALSFALLIDFNDAMSETLPQDAACIHALKASIAALNATYCGANPAKFFVFHRRRQFNPSEGCWMGWERKRGKLDEFNHLLRGAATTCFVINPEAIATLPKVRYVLTLDTDTVLPRDAAQQMIATLAHPLNRPRLSPDGRRVIGGYAILQPRVSFLYRAGFRSWFARFFAGSAGVDPYSTATSDTYMDLFSRGSFTGKGLYDIDAFMATAGSAFPENAILSHDLIESNYARCALATDIEVFDEFPSKYHAFAKREHRWIRGDWQLLPWLRANVPSPKGGTLPNVLPLLERWKIVDNLRRSVIAPAAFILLILAWTFLPSPAWGWTLFALLPWLLPSLMLTVDTLSQLRYRAAWRALPSQGKFEFTNTFGQAVLQVAVLPETARHAVDAIAGTLKRLLLTKRHFLEWETAASTEARMGEGLPQFLRAMWPMPLLTIGITGVILFLAPERMIVAAPVLLLWLTSPVIAWLASRSRLVIETPLTAAEEVELRRVAKMTWSFFEVFVGEADNGLPPDNYQETPLGLVAHRTSPTNIGLYLLSVLAARDIELIDMTRLLDRLHKAFDTLDKLERHRGHFYNWYETNTLVTMHPPYVSTVDSGNLLACLIALKHGLHELAEVHPEHAAGLLTLAGRADVMAAVMTFGFLYNADRELFSIGFNAATGRLDTNHYDLLASEACIASFLAVARGEVPRKHWFRLGRLVTLSAGRIGLVSWGGTMFEYLMPRLLLPTAPGVLLDQAQRTAVARQIEYGRETKRPWGISESGFALLDAGQVYQYQSFGVPGLGLKRGLERDHVVAPYATLMAVELDAAAAVKNFEALRNAGGEGPHGFYEAIDYTPERAGNNGEPKVVKSYMAHHQGMGFVAIVNRLTDGKMRQRFAREPAVRAAELLLDERVPYTAPVIEPDGPALDTPRETVLPDYPMRRRITTPHTPLPRTHLLSNGHYTTMVTNSGGGYSRCRELDVTRWRADATADADGQYLYIRDRRSGGVWSAVYQPTGRTPDEYEVTYSIDKAEFRRRDGDIESLLEIVVVPDQDVEVRRITLTNHGTRDRMLDVTSYAEIVLATHAADAAHPAFGKLFLETEWLSKHSAILCRRRPRAADQQPVFAIHCLTTDVAGTLSYETSRENFLGRRRSMNAPQALDANVINLKGNVGAVLDPIVAIRRSFLLRSNEKVVLAYTTGVAATREEAVALAERYHTMTAIGHAFELAWAHARIELQGSHWKPDDVHLFQRLAGHLYYPTGPLRATPETLTANRLGQTALWAFGISGDLPILLLRMHSAGGLLHLKQLLQAQSYWQTKGFAVDIVVLLENAGGYHDELHDDALALIRQAGRFDSLNRPAGIFLRKGFQMTEPERTVLLTTARVVLDDRSGPVASQADAAAAPRPLPARRTPPTAANRFEELPPLASLQFDNGTGGFSSDGNDYVIHARQVPPAPWSNVIANERGGFLVSDSGGGFAWAGNSQSNRLTPWSNDPVLDPPGEAVYIHDEDAEVLWCPTPLPMPTTGQIRVVHGQGYSAFTRAVESVQCEMTVFVPVNDPVKVTLLKLKNTSGKVKRLEIVYYAEWVLGTTREATLAHVVSRVDSETGAILAGNRFHPDIPNAIAFADSDMRPRTVTGDRVEFLGRNGRMAMPASFGRGALSGNVGAGLDPCAAIRGEITLSPGENRTVVFVLGEGNDPADARRMIRDYRNINLATTALAAVKAKWARLCETVQVQTPDASFDLLMNRWLIYQTLSCRLWGRSAFYQSGGAFGFRDQLQDVGALIHTAPEEVRKQILRAARRQFIEGDVQHWWHEPAGNGVRTRFSDDFLWLPYTIALYVSATGDVAILHESVPYLDAPLLTPEQHEVYGVPNISEQTGTLFEHCERAISYGWKLGAHGLPLMGTGDWNDGMNTVGVGGRGESVWVAWFQCVVLEQFAVLAELYGDAAIAIGSRANVMQLRDAIETHAWDGSWYRRAYFDDGTPLGSSTNDECQIDSLSQSWAVIAGGPKERATQAMRAVQQRLIREQQRLILLFEPPFDTGPLRPGYIRGYVPGVRENGGQYTHAAIWVVKALAGLHDGDAAHSAFALLNPITMPVATYRGEPYVMAADVYSQPLHFGRAGWTWYTGSCAWMYRVGLEDMLGLHREGQHLRFDPCIPAAWQEFTIHYRFGATLYRIICRNPSGVMRGVLSVSIDGHATATGILNLIDDGKPHDVAILLGRVASDK
ncbi:hypothetical protein BH11PLA2_BH11PLA2_10000 [soil metagenome]